MDYIKRNLLLSAINSNYVLQVGDIVDKTNETYDPILKEQILDYIFNNKFRLSATLGMPRTNVFTGQRWRAYGVWYADDVYSWTDELGFYLFYYHIKLPDDFLIHVKEQANTQDIPKSALWRSFPKQPEDPMAHGISLKLLPDTMSLEEKMAFLTDCRSKQDVLEKLKNNVS